MKTIRNIYRVVRSILFSLILFVVGFFLLLYVALSLPPMQNWIKGMAEEELSRLFKTEVSIGRVDFHPFNQVELYDVEVPTPEGSRCLDAEKIGAGIGLWRLIRKGEIEITYAEIIGLECRLKKTSPESLLNIQFIIDALKPKEPGKPPTKFDLRIHSIVIRKSHFSFEKSWLPRRSDPSLIDFNHLSLNNIRADINIPRLKNDDFDIDLRSLSFEEKSGFTLNDLSCRARLTKSSISVSDLQIELPGTLLRPSSLSLCFNGYSDIPNAFINGSNRLKLQSDKVTLSDFRSFAKPLGAFSDPMNLSLDAEGNAERIDLRNLLISTPDGRLQVYAKGYAANLRDRQAFAAEAQRLEVTANASEAEKIITRLANLPENVSDMLLRLGRIDFKAEGAASSRISDTKASLASGIGDIMIDGKIAFPEKRHLAVKAHVATDNFNLGLLLAETRLGSTSFDADADISVIGKTVNGSADAEIGFVEFGGKRLENVSVFASKNGEDAKASVESNDPDLDLTANAEAHLDGKNSTTKAEADIRNFTPSAFGVAPKLNGYDISGRIYADIYGNNPDTMSGFISVCDASMSGKTKRLRLDRLEIRADEGETGRTLAVASDWVDANIKGDFAITKLPGAFIALLGRTMPALAPALPSMKSQAQNLNFDITLAADNSLTEFFNLPFRLLTPVPIRGQLLDSVGQAALTVDIPYIQQGKDKLVRSTRLSAALDAENGGSRLDFSTTMPGKKGNIGLNLNLLGNRNDLLSDISWKIHREGIYDGKVSLSTTLQPAVKGSMFPGIDVKINPSDINVAGAAWHIGKSAISYHDKKISVDNILVSNGDQFVKVNGDASALPTDTVKVEFADFNLDYLFETLNINYVTFGGNATGKALATQVLSGHPIALTDGLTVENLSYNGAVLGDHAELKGIWDNNRKCVGINAHIFEEKHRVASIDGGVWVAGDSLSFDFDVDKVNIKFLKPFMQAFTSDVSGRASGKAKLYGTFKDIDMTGRLFADTIRMKVDYTNTWYAGSDSVFLSPGRIDIPDFRVYDRNGRSATVNGTVKHSYFHDPTFEFRLNDARSLLAYDTNAKMNPDWYGTVYVNGNATIKGRPGIVQVLVDVSTAANSVFTYALNDTEAVEEYTFLTFSDSRREAEEKAKPDTVPEFVKRFHKRIEKEQNRPSIFAIDLRVSVTPQAKLFIIMDPRAGDKITARGQGAMQIAYDSETDEMKMYGKYVIDEGNYNFTLQDLIIRDFKINHGSHISFNGDPLAATLDIEAAYRVNTSLSDLDKSFSTDRDLNRTNVPVDALLMVDGDLQNPEISYDIKLPTLTSDVERKVKSIISTDDQMSRQIMYLLALNRFYTPEYMATSSNGGELASVASSTISSQITNILGQISDKWSIAPSFRSDKGDFSDTEVDLALSSRLLNNRLLINGNFGYRDRTTSQTTFVGDFDIEYLLNRSGNLRLKAYNHFNDQNYYLRSSLTTQGIGIIYRRDFDNPFTFLRRKKKPAFILHPDSVKKD